MYAFLLNLKQNMAEIIVGYNQNKTPTLIDHNLIVQSNEDVTNMWEKSICEVDLLKSIPLIGPEWPS